MLKQKITKHKNTYYTKKLSDYMVSVNRAFLYNKSSEKQLTLNVNKIEKYFKNGADTNQLILSRLFLIATHNGYQEFNQLLLLKGAIDGNKALVEFALKWGANVDARDYQLNTPLIFASINGNIDVIKLLLDNQATINAVNTSNQNALHHASVNGHEDIVLLLLKSGANFQDQSGILAFMVACNKGYFKIVKLLLEANSDVGLRSKWVKTTLSLSNGQKVKDILVQHEAKEASLFWIAFLQSVRLSNVLASFPAEILHCINTFIPSEFPKSLAYFQKLVKINTVMVNMLSTRKDSFFYHNGTINRADNEVTENNVRGQILPCLIKHQ